MLQIVQSIYDMTGEMVKLPLDEDTAQKVRYRRLRRGKQLIVLRSQRVDKIFAMMDLNHDHQRAFFAELLPFALTLTRSSAVTFEEFKEGSKKDPTIVQVSSLYPSEVLLADTTNAGPLPLRRTRVANRPSTPLQRRLAFCTPITRSLPFYPSLPFYIQRHLELLDNGDAFLEAFLRRMNQDIYTRASGSF